MTNFFSTLFASFKKLLSIAEGKDTIDNVDALRKFITHNSNFVTQTSLYGYIKTRSGIQYPRVFEDNSYIKQLNIAKWRIWISCISDLSVFIGGLLAQGRMDRNDRITGIIKSTTDQIIAACGAPPYAKNAAFHSEIEKLERRIGNCDWTTVKTDLSTFSESPKTLVAAAPVITEFKKSDREILINSVRFKWHGAIRSAKKNLVASALICDQKSN